MDALEIMAKMDEIFLVFQPVFAAGRHEIIGYEVQPKLVIDGKERDLTPFFYDESVPEEDRIEVGRLLRKEAYEEWNNLEQTRLFLNLNPALYLEGAGDLLFADLQNIDRLQVVIGFFYRQRSKTGQT